MQHRFTYRAKFQKSFNDRGEIRSNRGYSTSLIPATKSSSVGIAYFNYKNLRYTILLRGKLVDYPRLLFISPRSLNNFWNFARYANRGCTGHATMSKSLNIFFWNFPRQSPRCTGQATRSIDEENCFVYEGDRVTRLELLGDWPEKNIFSSGQSAERNSTTSGTGSVKISSQGFSSSWSKLSPENISSSQVVAPGLPRMMCTWYSRGIEITAQKVLQEKGEHLMRAASYTNFQKTPSFPRRRLHSRWVPIRTSW